MNSEVDLNDVVEIGQIVMDSARLVFEALGCPSDFCLQSVSTTGAVFGGTNRIIWNPSRGFRPDPMYCTPRFLSDFRSLFGELPEVRSMCGGRVNR